MWKFLSPFTCRTMRDFSSRSVGRGQCHWGGGVEAPRMGGGYSQLLMTPPRGSPLKSNSMSMYLPWGRGLGQERGSWWDWQLHSPHPHRCAPSPIRAHRVPPLSPDHSRIGRSCHYGQSWRFQRLQERMGVMVWSRGTVLHPGRSGMCEVGLRVWALTLQHRVGLQELLLHLVHLLPFAAHGCHVGHHQLAGLCQRGAGGHCCGAVGSGAVPLTPPAPLNASSPPCSPGCTRLASAALAGDEDALVPVAVPQ